MRPFADGETSDPRQQSFGAPAKKTGDMGILKAVLSLALAITAVYGLYKWTLHQQVPTVNSLPTTPAASIQPAPPQARTTLSSPPATAEGARVITKCVVKGKTSYGDDACPEGAVTTAVVTKQDHNLVAGLSQSQMAATRPFEEATSSSHNLAQVPDTEAAKAAECKAIDAQIASLDAQARQPLSGQMQDYIKQQRKELRDRQFRLGCR